MSRWNPSTHAHEYMVFYLLIYLLMSRRLIMICPGVYPEELCVAPALLRLTLPSPPQVCPPIPQLFARASPRLPAQSRGNLLWRWRSQTRGIDGGAPLWCRRRCRSCSPTSTQPPNEMVLSTSLCRRRSRASACQSHFHLFNDATRCNQHPSSRVHLCVRVCVFARARLVRQGWLIP